MAISEANREFISGLIDYYVSTASSYREMAGMYKEFTDSVDDAAFGMIAGSVYSSFMQIYQNRQITPSLEDMGEFEEIMMGRVAEIKRAIAGAGRPAGGEAGGGGESGRQEPQDFAGGVRS